MNVTQLSNGRGWLDADAAASLHRIDAALGHPMQVTEAGRTWARQNQHYQAYLNGTGALALHPDTPSVHQLGNAIDTDEGQSHLDLLEDHGWIRTVFRNGRLIEPWHYEYSRDRDNHYDETDDMFTDEDRAMLRKLLTQLGGSDDRKTSARQDIDAIKRQTTETAQILGSTVARARKGDTLGTRLDKIIAHLSGRKELTKND